ncbi:MAG: hypothetical protein VB118_05375 [Oscillospiraceae bacterium]|nr:hypothetical protein [Oscillospiraceae bacterium]
MFKLLAKQNLDGYETLKNVLYPGGITAAPGIAYFPAASKPRMMFLRCNSRDVSDRDSA